MANKVTEALCQSYEKQIAILTQEREQFATQFSHCQRELTAMTDKCRELEMESAARKELLMRMTAGCERLKIALAHRKVMVYRANNKGLQEVWYWQGDGFDHPESLVCPIFIEADDFRAILRELSEAKARIDQVKAGWSARSIDYGHDAVVIDFGPAQLIENALK